MTHQINKFGEACCPNCNHPMNCVMLTSLPPQIQYSCDYCGYLEIDGEVKNEGANITREAKIEDSKIINILNDADTVYAINNSDKCLHPNIRFAYAGTDGLHYHCCHCGEDIVTTWYDLLKPTVDRIIEEHKSEQ